MQKQGTWPLWPLLIRIKKSRERKSEIKEKVEAGDPAALASID